MRFRFPRAAVAVGLLAACGGTGGDKPTDSTTAASSTVAAVPAVYTIVAKDFSYEAPDTITAGMVTLRLVNQGPELHHVQILKLDDGKTAADLEAGLKQMKPDSPPPPWVHEVAGPNSPVPGGEQSVTQDLAPGNYVLICFIPSADKMPHAMKGMMKALTIVPATSANAAAPTADITVKMTDYAWTVTPELTAGAHVLKIENEAAQAHELFILQLAPGNTVADLAKWVGEMKGPPPGKPIGGITGMMKGTTVYVPVNLEPGEYGMYCFLPDAKDGKMHVEHGMMKQFSVK